MKRSRVNPNHKQKARLLQEASNKCTFCNFNDAGLLEFHHIDGNSANTILENLICVCPTCHAKITANEISIDAVKEQKLKIQGVSTTNIKSMENTKFTINAETVNNPVLGNNNTVNITVKKQVTKKIVEKYPEGSIGRDTLMCGYAKYLADQYVEFKNFELKQKGEEFNYPALYGKVKKDFKSAGFFFIPQSRFDELVKYLQSRIDRTVLAKINKGKGVLKNYTAFEEYKKENG